MQASFGAFWRIEQLLISTTPDTLPSHKLAASGLPPIVVQDRVHDHIKWLFAVQAEVDALSVPYTHSSTGEIGNATLSSICFKPLGGACAIESVLQYWQMDADIYNMGRLSPDFCFGHWSTQCRSAFESPIDPHTVLGGFPTDSSFRSFAEDATSFVVTYPVDSSPENRQDFTHLCMIPLYQRAQTVGSKQRGARKPSMNVLHGQGGCAGIPNLLWNLQSPLVLQLLSMT